METDLEKGQALADVSFVLRAVVRPRQHTRYTRTYPDCFRASETVEALLTLGLTSHRQQAVQVLQKLWRAGFLQSVSHTGESAFHDGTHLYRFASHQELQHAMHRWTQDAMEATDENVYRIALQTTLDLPVTTTTEEDEDLFSDEDMDSVLGRPGEYDWSSLSA